MSSSGFINTDDLTEITDSFDVRVYVHKDPLSGDENVHIRFSKDGKFDIGLDLGYHSKTILEGVRD